jgi:TRAP-type mannitol/chloroaromatic compound transport system permease small subunit
MNAVKKYLIRLLQVIDTVSDAVGKAVSFLIIPIMLVALTIIISRRLLPYTGITIWTSADEELPTFAILLSVYFNLGAGYALHTHAFINFDLIQTKFSPAVKAWLTMATYLLFFVAFGALAWMVTQDLIAGIQTGIDAAGPGTPTPLMRLEAYIQVLTLITWPAGLFLLLLEGASRFIEALVVILQGDTGDGR